MNGNGNERRLRNARPWQMAGYWNRFEFWTSAFGSRFPSRFQRFGVLLTESCCFRQVISGIQWISVAKHFALEWGKRVPVRKRNQFVQFMKVSFSHFMIPELIHDACSSNTHWKWRFMHYTFRPKMVPK